METKTLCYFLLRDLDKLVVELEAFPNEAALWLTAGSVQNCAGNLGLHIAGNLRHYIGATLGHSGYVRQRDLEFSEKNVPRAAILANLADARTQVTDVLNAMTVAALDQLYPADYFGEGRSNFYVLLTLLAHLNYHLGQVNYLRRML